MTRRTKLLVVGENLKVKIRSYAGAKKYKTVRELRLRSKNVQLDLEQIKEKVKDLQERYPEKGFYFEKHRVVNLSADDTWTPQEQEENFMAREMMCWIFGRREKGAKNIPLYWSSRFQRLYVPSSYYNHQKRLTCSMISYRLRDFGIRYDLAYV